MGFKRGILYLLLSVLMIVSFQNCGQQGAIALENQSQSKVAVNDLIDISDVQEPPKQGDSLPNDDQPISLPPDSGVDDPPVQYQPIKVPPPGVPVNPKDEKDSCDNDDDEETSDVVNADDDGNIKGKIVSCADLLRMQIPAIGSVDNKSEYKNTRRFLSVNGQGQLSIENHRGLLFLSNIGIIANMKNVRSVLARIQAKAIQNMSNFRALSLIDSQRIDSLANYRGLSCIASRVGKIENFRGILEVKGDIESVSNFRGILRVEGSVKSIENFRGVLIVSGQIGVKKNVRVRNF